VNHGRVVITEIATVRLLVVSSILGLVLAAFVVIGLRDNLILFATDHPARGAVKHTSVIVSLGAFIVHLLRYVYAAHMSRGAGLYIEAGRLVWLRKDLRSEPIGDIAAIRRGPGSVFVREPQYVRFEMAHAKPLTIYTLYRRTPFDEMISRLRQAGVTAPVEEIPQGKTEASRSDQI
jgi:hypothetical protein